MGQVAHVKALVEWALSRHIGVAVIVPNEGHLTDWLSAKGVAFCNLGCGRWLRLSSMLPAMVKLVRLVDRLPAHAVIHAHGRASALQVAMIPRSALGGRRRAVTIHQEPLPARRGWFGISDALERWSIRRFDGVWLVSESLRCYEHRASLTRHIVRVIPNWLLEERVVSGSSHDRTKTCGSRPLQLVGVGRLSYEKGWDRAVDLVAEIRGLGIPVVMDIFGEGAEYVNLQGLISDRGLADVVTMRGSVDGAADLLSEYDYVVVPSRTESFGMVALEALREQTLVLAANIAGLSEVVGEAGLLLDFEDVPGAARAFARFHGTPSMVARARRAMRTQLSLYSQSAIGPRVEEFFRAVISP